MAPTLSFIVPVRNDAVRLRRCLETIRATSGGFQAEIVVVDNGSTDDSVVVARDAGARVLVMPDVRVSVLRNAGARAAAADLLAFVDADHELSPDWTTAARDLFADDAVGAAGAQYLAPADGTWVQRMYDALRQRQTGHQPAVWLPSGNLAVRRIAFESIGGFDDTLVTCEDVDLCRRLRAKGWQLIEAGELRSVHRGDPATLVELFRGELWRGRDNLRVSLRQIDNVRDVIGMAIPLAVLAAVLALLSGLLAVPFAGWSLAAAGALVLTLPLIARSMLLLKRTTHRGSRTRRVVEALLVSAAYDLARAIALIVPGSHQSRQRAAQRRAAPTSG